MNKPLRSGIAGAIATGVALGASEFIAGVLRGATSLVAAVGQFVIDHQPPGAKDVVVALFGTNDKLALELFVVIVALAIGAGLGVVALRRPWLTSGAFVAFGIVGFLAALGMDGTEPAIAAAATAVAVGIGLWILERLSPRETKASADGSTPSVGSMPDWDRRSFLVRAGSYGAAAVVAGVAGRTLLDRQRAAPNVGGTPLPPPSDTVADLAPGADLSPTIEGLTPLVMPNDRFYRIDTSLLPPVIDVDTWTLRVHGMVERETTLTFAELAGLPMFEQYVTIACVSNEVGGKLVGNAKWTGVRLREVLEIAGVNPAATQLVGRSVDGWTAGMPTAWVMDPSREPMIALKMNDEPLPVIHGFPARLIIPGLYGYVSATKWLSDLELTTMEAFDGYWVPLGWAKEAPILTQSRIDVPGRGQTIAGGRVRIAGIAWAPDRGVSRVEVAVDGDWRDATVSAPISDTTWVQWVREWDATPGEHQIMVRATDGNGVVQTEERSRPEPDGARGWHTIPVKVA